MFNVNSFTSMPFARIISIFYRIFRSRYDVFVINVKT